MGETENPHEHRWFVDVNDWGERFEFCVVCHIKQALREQTKVVCVVCRGSGRRRYQVWNEYEQEYQHKWGSCGECEGMGWLVVDEP